MNIACKLTPEANVERWFWHVWGRNSCFDSATCGVWVSAFNASLMYMPRIAYAHKVRLSHLRIADLLEHGQEPRFVVGRKQPEQGLEVGCLQPQEPCRRRRVAGRPL